MLNRHRRAESLVGAAQEGTSAHKGYAGCAYPWGSEQLYSRKPCWTHRRVIKGSKHYWRPPATRKVWQLASLRDRLRDHRPCLH